MTTKAEPKSMTDWYMTVSAEQTGKGKKSQPYRRGVVGSFQIDIRMNDQDSSALGVQIEGVKKDGNVLELTIITPDDERYLIRSTVSGNEVSDV